MLQFWHLLHVGFAHRDHVAGNRALVTSMLRVHGLDLRIFKKGGGLCPCLFAVIETFFHCSEPIASHHGLSAIKPRQQTRAAFKALPQLLHRGDRPAYLVLSAFHSASETHHLKTCSLFSFPLNKEVHCLREGRRGSWGEDTGTGLS